MSVQSNYFQSLVLNSCEVKPAALALSDQTTICTFSLTILPCPSKAGIRSDFHVSFDMGSAKKAPHILEAADNKVVFSLTFLCRDLQKKKNPKGKKCQKKCYNGAKIDKYTLFENH